jgi:methionyl-tRNA synthetase
VLAPFLPFSSQKLHGLLGFQGEAAAEGWGLHPVRPGQNLGPAETLFTKLDEAVVAEESSRLGNGHG